MIGTRKSGWTFAYDDVTFAYDDVTFAYDDVTFASDDVTFAYDDRDAKERLEREEELRKKILVCARYICIFIHLILID